MLPMHHNRELAVWVRSVTKEERQSRLLFVYNICLVIFVYNKCLVIFVYNIRL